MEGGLLYTPTEQPNTFKMISETPTGLIVRGVFENVTPVLVFVHFQPF